MRSIHRADPGATIVAELSGVSESIAWLEAHPSPDLVFCDIRLSDGLALRIFERVPLRAPVIFCTAYDEYVLDAFAHHGIDYVLKPIEDARVAAALARYADLREHFLREERVEPLSGTLGRPRRRFLVKRGGELRSIPAEDVAYFTTEDRLVLLVDREGKQYPLDTTLARLASELDPTTFFRVSRSLVVSYGAVKRCRALGKGRLSVELAPSGEHVVPQETASAFRAWLDR